MSDNGKEKTPHKVDGTIDWEAVFEDEETGLIKLISQVQTAAHLKQCTLIVISKLFEHDEDNAHVQKFSAELNRIIPDDETAEHQNEEIDALRERVIALLRIIEEEEKQIAAAAKAAPPSEHAGNAERAGLQGQGGPGGGGAHAATHGVTPQGAPSPVHKKPSLPWGQWVFLGLFIALATGVAGYFILAGEKGRITDQDISWVRHYMATHLPSSQWKLLSVEAPDKAKINVEILVADAEQIKQMGSLSSMMRANMLQDVCPPIHTRVKGILERGGKVWITLKNAKKTLTGGTCKY